ncbi:hypothetical protein [Dactylosporangium darangshiense]|uniref:hypothetical protein n=1 Tax=Dactylosporangium darangshiense TaxID=579108 RepID=UPI003629D514
MAELLLRRGDAAQARHVVEEAVGNLWRNRHEHVADALALRAAIVPAYGSGGAAVFPDLRVLRHGPPAGGSARPPGRHGRSRTAASTSRSTSTASRPRRSCSASTVSCSPRTPEFRRR